MITGHTGFKGAWLSIWLDDLGANVIGYALEPPYSNSLFELARLKDRIVDIRADIRDCKRLNDVFREHKPDIVIHLAAQSLVRRSYEIPAETFETNVMGTVNVLECLRKNVTKSAVLITSDKCYKNVEQEEGYVETDALSDQDPYSCSKGSAEMAVQSYRDSFGIKAATARAGNVLGGGDWAKDRLVPDVIRALIKNEEVVMRNPHATRPWQFVLDLLYGYLILAERQYEGEDLSSPWNFGPDSSSIVSVQALVEMIIKKWGEGSIRVLKDRFGRPEASLLCLDSTKARTLLGWKPRLSMLETVDFVVDWYKNYRNRDVYSLTIQQLRRYESL